MPETDDRIDVEAHDLEGCKTPRQFLEHSKTAQFLRVYNEKRRRVHTDADGEFREITLDHIKCSKELTSQLANFAIREDESIRLNMHLSDTLRSTIRSVQHALNEIQWEQADDSHLDQEMK